MSQAFASDPFNNEPAADLSRRRQATVTPLPTNPRLTPTSFHEHQHNLAPSRLNLAGFCVMCFRYRCKSSTCVAQHAQADWQICRLCDGSGFNAKNEDLCNCVGGYIDMLHSEWTRRVTARPPRLNFAGYCLWCSERWCNEPVCVDHHTHSRWGVCDRCDGLGIIEPDQDACGCAYGLIETAFTSR